MHFFRVVVCMSDKGRYVRNKKMRIYCVFILSTGLVVVIYHVRAIEVFLRCVRDRWWLMGWRRRGCNVLRLYSSVWDGVALRFFCLDRVFPKNRLSNFQNNSWLQAENKFMSEAAVEVGMYWPTNMYWLMSKILLNLIMWKMSKCAINGTCGHIVCKKKIIFNTN